MYQCRHCLLDYTEKELEINRVVSPTSKTIIRCQRCFKVDIILYGFKQECPICLDRISKIHFDCGHSVCIICGYQINDKQCPICKQTSTNLNQPMSFGDFYFETTSPKIKNLFKKMYIELEASYTKPIYAEELYDLCVEYYKFLYLLHHNSNNDNPIKLSVSKKIDIIWKYYFNKKNYEKICNEICGYKLDYQTSDSSEARLKTFELYQEKFPNSTNIAIWKNIYSFRDGIIQLFFKTFSGEVLTISVEKNSTIYRLKMILYKIEGVPPNWLRLIWSCRQLENAQTLDFYGIVGYQTIHMVSRLCGD